jgi:hypothetical protein
MAVAGFYKDWAAVGGGLKNYLAYGDLPAGTVRRLQPRFSRDYPRTLTAHDIGLKDLLDTFYLLENPAEIVLFAVTIPTPQEVGLDLSPAITEQVNKIVELVLAEAKSAARDPPLRRLANPWPLSLEGEAF